MQKKLSLLYRRFRDAFSQKTVNQDDIYTYHTYFADDLGTPGTTMTFFDFPNNPKGLKGTNTISRTGFRVPSDATLTYYENRFNEFAVKHTGISEEFGKKSFAFGILMIKRIN